MLMRLILSGAVLIGALGAPAAAQQPQATAPQSETKADPRQERICETVTMLGSRLAKKKFCATRAEWEEMRLRDRQAVEKAQTSPCVYQSTGASGRPSC
jgi:hypothetical protein